jgi:hypothetical protein
MKKYIFLLLISGLIMAGSCSEDFLDMKPALSQSTHNSYETEDDFQVALTAVYATYRDMLGSYYAMTELRSDNTINQYHESNRGTAVIPYEELDEFTMTSENGLNGYWGTGLNAVYRVNTLLQKAGEASDGIFKTTLNGAASSTKSIKNRIVAEARFARAFHYFNLVRFYGAVPLVTEPIEFIDDAFTVTRTPVADVYTQILADVQFAIDSLPTGYTGADKGRITRGAALTLKAKVQMTLLGTGGSAAEWGEVVNTLEAITSITGTNKYELMSLYVDCFDPTKKNSKEAIFEVQYGETVNENNGTVFAWVPRGGDAWKTIVNDGGDGNGSAWNIPTRDLVNSYEPDDTRKDVSVQEISAGTYSSMPVPYINKWIGYSMTTEKSRNPCNMPIYRFADVKLMLAEAYYRAGQPGKAQTELNDVRTRAFAPNTPPPVTGDFLLAVERERRLELAFEGHRWFDLLRTGRAKEVMHTYGITERANPTCDRNDTPYSDRAFEVQDYMLLYPVPYHEWIKNPSITEQNPQW